LLSLNLITLADRSLALGVAAPSPLLVLMLLVLRVLPLVTMLKQGRLHVDITRELRYLKHWANTDHPNESVEIEKLNEAIKMTQTLLHGDGGIADIPSNHYPSVCRVCLKAYLLSQDPHKKSNHSYLPWIV
jgi:hypothetical protein